MNPIEQLARGLGAGPFQRIPSAGTIAPPQPRVGPSPMATATPPVLTSEGTSRRMRMEQALPTNQSSVGSNYQWAILNVAANIGGHTFQAGTRIAVAPSQTSTSGGGKAHTTSIVTKVWAKFGQTFDASSWVEGAISSSLYTLTGQTATWSTSTGFGAIDEGAKTAAVGGLGFAGGFLIGAAVGAVALLIGADIYYTRKEQNERYRRAGYSGR